MRDFLHSTLPATNAAAPSRAADPGHSLPADAASARVPQETTPSPHIPQSRLDAALAVVFAKTTVGPHKPDRPATHPPDHPGGVPETNAAKSPQPALALRMARQRVKSAATGAAEATSTSTVTSQSEPAAARVWHSASFISKDERRQFPRRDSKCTVKMHVLKEGETKGDERHTDWLLHSSRAAAELLDISMSGLALGVADAIPQGTRLLLRLKNRQFDRRLDTIAVVLRSEPEADGDWRIVCQFEQKLSFEQVHDFGQHLFQSAIV